MSGSFFGFLKKEKKLGISQGKRRYDLPLNKGESTSFLVMLVALMSFLAIMALGATVTLQKLTDRWKSGLENKLTIEIPAEKSSGGLRTADDIEYLKRKISETLSEDENVVAHNVLSNEDVQDLISPWLGENMTFENIPMPGLVSVELVNSNNDIKKELEKNLKTINADIRMDAHEEWLGSLLRMIGTLQFAAAFVIFIIGMTTITAIAGGIRSRMAELKADVELLHLMGASDYYITRQFQRHAFNITLKGSISGTIIGAISLIGIAGFTTSAESTILPDLTITHMHIGGMITLPLLACLIATYTARLTVLRALGTMP